MILPMIEGESAREAADRANPDSDVWAEVSTSEACEAMNGALRYVRGGFQVIEGVCADRDGHELYLTVESVGVRYFASYQREPRGGHEFLDRVMRLRFDVRGQAVAS